MELGLQCTMRLSHRQWENKGDNPPPENETVARKTTYRGAEVGLRVNIALSVMRPISAAAQNRS
jgi:hypothetical protein